MKEEINDQEARKNVLVRLRRIEGQVRGVQRMVENEAECSEIMNQIAAIKSAVNHVGLLVFESHARECIARSLDEKDNEQSFEEIVKIMGRFIK
ncbi:MAG TPA: metal-sensitive transcriptional regulator [Syntrophomonas sp.]|jgi:DNA-binding FrmR family transcriptional regulator|nr:metal-sensitive transcriptional regulator [Syntrophomonas sp.]HRW11809.1 metal-sensitive transcriptional regulator [Syntrophomonas sp.]